MTQMSEYKPLEDEDFEYDVSFCPKKNHNQIAYFLYGHGLMLYRENWIFTPSSNLFFLNRNFYTPKITNWPKIWVKS